MTGTKRDNYFAIIMAGGVGSRFWPASKASHPKQFLDILGNGETLFQTTFKRLKKIIPAENIYVLTNAAYVEMIKEQMPNIKDEQIVPEPAMRNTAPSILLGTLKIHKKNPNAITLVAPSDHHIKDEEKFTVAVQQAFDNVEEKDRLITLGITPNSPNTGYGYINFDTTDGTSIKKVKNFTEKPTLKGAEKFLEDGDYLWNAGIFVWSTKFILKCFREFLPEMESLLSKGEKFFNETSEQEFLEEYYPQAENLSIDFGIMEKAQEVFVIPVDFGWSDLGTWTSLDAQLPKD